MKKILIVLLACLCLVSLAGCSSKDSETAGGTTSAPKVKESKIVGRWVREPDASRSEEIVFNKDGSGSYTFNETQPFNWEYKDGILSFTLHNRFNDKDELNTCVITEVDSSHIAFDYADDENSWCTVSGPYYKK